MPKFDELPRFTRSLRVNTTLEPRRILKSGVRSDTVKLQLKRSSTRGYIDSFRMNSLIKTIKLQEPNLEGVKNVFEKQ